METKDKLVYFNIYGRAEPIRMLYAVAGQDLDDVRVEFDDWPSAKSEYPLGQLPVLITTEGTISQSNTIARFVARRFHLMGDNLMQEALHDVVVQTSMDMNQAVSGKIYPWLVREAVPVPDDSEKLIAEAREKVLNGLAYIQSIAEQRGKEYIIADTIGLADVWLYSSMEFMNKAFPDCMKLTPWLEQLVAKVESDSRIKEYLATRIKSVYGI